MPLVTRGVVSRHGDILGLVTSIASVLWPGLVQFQKYWVEWRVGWGAVKARRHDPLIHLGVITWVVGDGEPATLTE